MLFGSGVIGVGPLAREKGRSCRMPLQAGFNIDSHQKPGGRERLAIRGTWKISKVWQPLTAAAGFLSQPVELSCGTTDSCRPVELFCGQVGSAAVVSAGAIQKV